MKKLVFIFFITLLSCEIDDTEGFSKEKEQAEIDKYLKDNPDKFPDGITSEGYYYQNITTTTHRPVTADDTIDIFQKMELLSGVVVNSGSEIKNIIIASENETKVIDGIKLGVQIMKLGEKGLFLFPSELAYGNMYPPYTPYLVEIEILKIGQDTVETTPLKIEN